MNLAARGFRVRWWMWLIVLAVVVAASLLALRISGYIALARLQDDLARRGLPDLAWLMTTGTRIDQARQRRLAAEAASTASWADQHCGRLFNDYREMRTTPKELAARATLLGDGAGELARIGAILDEGPVRFDLLGWLEPDQARISKLSPREIWSQNAVRGYMRARDWCTWLGLQACLTETPLPQLHRLDQIDAAASQPSCLVDAMFAIAIHVMRDQTYAWLATRGRLPAEALSRWAAEEPPHLAWLSRGMAGERLLCAAPASRMEWSQIVDTVSWDLMSGSRLPAWRAWPRAFLAWEIQGFETTIAVAQAGTYECSLRNLPAPPIKEIPLGLPAQISAGIGNVDESLISTYECAYAHRMTRLLALCAASFRAGRGLPEDTATLRRSLPGDLLAARSPNEPAITYERLSSSRLRLGLAPKESRPPSVPAARWNPSYGSTIGSPPTLAAYDWHRWSLEIDLDAILIPPPPPKPRTPKPSPPPAGPAQPSAVPAAGAPGSPTP